MIEIETMIGGRHCYARVTHYSPGDPGYISGPADHCYPPEPPELDFEILDMQGKRSKHLESLMTGEEWGDIYDSLMLAIANQEE
jgi:hypothetical protein